MRYKQLSKPLLGLIVGTLFWSATVILAWISYFSGGEGWEGAGFLLLIFGLPSSSLLTFFDVSIFNQILLMSLFGYLQWPLIGFVLALFFKRKT